VDPCETNLLPAIYFQIQMLFVKIRTAVESQKFMSENHLLLSHTSKIGILNAFCK